MKAEVKVIELADKYYQIEGTDCIFPKEKALSVTVEIDPVLIAKAGEWVKIGDFGVNIFKRFTSGKPYILSRDLYTNSACLMVKFDDEGEIAGPNSFNIPTNMKFEKCSEPEPQRKSLGIYEGVEIYEETRSWFVDLETLEIRAPEGFDLENWVEDNINNESKVYLTPKEANARLKEEVIKKAIDYPFTLAELEKYDFAIEAFEKDHNITYIPE